MPKKQVRILPAYALCRCTPPYCRGLEVCDDCLPEILSMVTKGELILTTEPRPDTTTIDQWVKEMYE
jgi:hypothetical protein